jgi:hypothetical protein
MTAEDRLIAYLDGELPPDARSAFEAEIATDPALAAAVDHHRALAAHVAQAYAPVLDEPIPPHLIALASAANDPEPRRSSVRPWAALAASLVLGVAAGHELWPHAGPLTVQDGALVARGDLANALTTQLASQSAPGTVKVGLSFRARDGRLCRTFQSPADRLAGLACRADGRWVAEVTSAWNPQAQTDYRTAASAVPPAVLAAVDAMAVGETLDAAQERAARDSGWAPRR